MDEDVENDKMDESELSLIEIVPHVVLEKVMQYLNFQDKISFRSASKSLECRCTTMDNSLRRWSLEITDKHFANYQDIYPEFSQVLNTAKAKGFGNFRISLRIEQLGQEKQQSVLEAFINDVYSLRISGNEEFLMKDTWKFPWLEKLSLGAYPGITEALLSRHADTLKDLTVADSAIDHNLSIASLNVEKITLYEVSQHLTESLLRASKDSLKTLHIWNKTNIVYRDVNIPDKLPALEDLALCRTESELNKPLLRACRESLETLQIRYTNLDTLEISDCAFRGLKRLKLNATFDNIALLFLRNCKYTLTELELNSVHGLANLDQEDLNLPNLANLKLEFMDEVDTDAILMASKGAIRKLHLNTLYIMKESSHHLPNLDTLILLNVQGEYMSFIAENASNITTLGMKAGGPLFRNSLPDSFPVLKQLWITEPAHLQLLPKCSDSLEHLYLDNLSGFKNKANVSIQMKSLKSVFMRESSPQIGKMILDKNPNVPAVFVGTMENISNKECSTLNQKRIWLFYSPLFENKFPDHIQNLEKLHVINFPEKESVDSLRAELTKLYPNTEVNIRRRTKDSHSVLKEDMGPFYNYQL